MSEEWGSPGENVRIKCEDTMRRTRIFVAPKQKRLVDYMKTAVVEAMGPSKWYLDKREVTDADERLCQDVGDKTVFVTPCPRGQVLDDGKFALLEILPNHVANTLKLHALPDSLEEVFLQVGRKPELRQRNSEFVKRFTNDDNVCVFTEDEAKALYGKVSFGPDGRATMTGSAPHRFAVVKQPFPDGEPTAFSIRFSRWVRGAADPLDSYIENRQNILLVGAPGSGKTTVLKDVARKCSEKHATVVVDMLGEICGNSDQPHKFLEHVRRIDVVNRVHKPHAIETAFTNMAPTWILLDELVDKAEVESTLSATHRGVGVIASIHGTSLKSIVQNPMTVDLMGGSQAVILSQTEREQRRSSRKACFERIGPPCFDVVVEISSMGNWHVIEKVAEAVDRVHLGHEYTDLVVKV
eukprot:TRINITY_DN3088_c8_g1_i1.p1 TRINITY_DN3088_c8_g1~~TRINITY_DN3088_c8_g1_i1.p1  ORF type:complete len:410 (+),score=80.15 TRINITY_DN3088_c8_g1_i1:62-1291(+)